jgi:hypothetical protein
LDKGPRSSQFLWRRSLTAPQQAQHELDDDEDHDAGLEQDEAAVPRHVEYELQRFLHAAQLQLEGVEAVAEVELVAQVLGKSAASVRSGTFSGKARAWNECSAAMPSRVYSAGAVVGPS